MCIRDSPMNDLLKAALIHFYIAYLHPWFDGNGRMARLMHLWYLVQQQYSSALFVPLSEYVEKSRRAYYLSLIHLSMCIRDRAFSAGLPSPRLCA